MKKLVLAVIGVMVFFGCKKSDITRELPSAASKASVISYKEMQPKLFEQPTNVPKYKGLMVKFKNNNQRSIIGKTRAEYVHTKAMERANYNGYYVMQADNVEAEVSRLRASSEVEWVSPNWTEKILDIAPNDPYYVSGEMYGLSRINAPAAWNSGNVGKETVYVVVIDEGSMYWHCDLNGKVWVNQEELNGVAGVDDDGNGYIDDVHGWNWFDGTKDIYNGNNDHATHCEGTIAAKGNNGIGVIGVAPNVKTISLKFLSDYGFDNDAILAIDYAIDLKVRKGLNIKIMSNSWGGGGFNQGLIDAIDRARAADILFVCAAGNSNNNNDVNAAYSYPSAYPNDNIISVGASDWTDTKAGFSSYGKTSCDLFAPGVNIWSCLPTATHTSGYGQYSGTSMATPHVSGGLALLSSVRPELSWSQLKAELLFRAKKVPQLINYCLGNEQGGNLLDVSSFTGVTSPIIPNAVCGTPPPLDMTPPPTPKNLVITETTLNDPTYGNSVRLQWDTAGFFQTWQYNVWMKRGNASFQWIGSVGGNWAARVAGLELDVYSFYIVGQSKFGALSPNSNTVTADLTDPVSDTEPPSIPQNLRSSDIGELSFRLSWDASTDNHTTPTYRVNWRKIGNTNWTQTMSNSTSYLVSAFVESNATYDCKVEARDAAGNYSAAGNVIQVTTGSNQPPPVPDTQAPTLNGNPTTSNVTTASITFNHLAASDNVGVTGYTVNWRASGGSWLQRSSSNLSETFSNLSANTTYEFYYTARDAAGNISLQSQTVSATTLIPEPPPPPSITVTLSGFVNGQQHNLSWVTNATIVTQVLQIKDKGTWSNIYTSNSPFSYTQTSNKKFFYRVIVNGVISNEVGLQSKK